MPSIKWNKGWGTYSWSEDGDEWKGQAVYCGQPYEAWKESVHAAFILPYVSEDTAVIEVAPGHGRWSEFLIAHAGRVHLVDLNDACIEACRQRFAAHEQVTYAVTDGRSLPGVADATVDFIWSYDSFVHIEPDAIAGYLREFARALRVGGRAVIHHAGRRDSMLRYSFLARLGPPGRYLFKRLSMKRDTMGATDGRRSMVSRELFARMARAAGLEVEFQVDSWGEQHQFDCRRFLDVVTCVRRAETNPSRA